MDSNHDDSLDHFISGSSTGQTSTDNINQHLSYPALDPEEHLTRPESSSQPQGPQLSKDRIYVGNLSSSVDEYTLVQVFSKFGKLTNVDYLFHKAGPMKGKPRGYAFIKYADEGDAQKAMSTAHDKLLRGRKIIVTYAHHALMDSAGGAGGKGRRAMMEIGRPTTLSLLKSRSVSRPIGTAAKIAKMEAKLRQLERQPDTPSNPTPLHPSLPPKPQTSTSEPQINSNTRRTMKTKSSSASKPDVPPPSLLKFTSSPLTSPPFISSTSSKPSKPKPKLLGVKIKPKEKDKSVSAAAPKTD